MNSAKMAERFLRIIGVLLILLGAVHLIATPYIPRLLDGSPQRVYGQAVGPTLLNHVLVGILLLPLGFTTWLAAEPKENGQLWAKRVLVMNAVVVLTLPLCLTIFMRQPQYYTAPLFVIAVALVAAISLLMLAATVLLLKRQSPANR